MIVGGFYGYKYFVAGPRAEKAASMMFMAEQHFVADSFHLALNGDGNFDGFLKVIDKYGSTPQGNLAQHYAGICYLQLGQYEEALAHLKKYSAPKGVPGALLEAQNYGLQGDACVQLQNYKEAASMYQKAIGASDNGLTGRMPAVWRHATSRNISAVSNSFNCGARCKAAGATGTRLIEDANR